MFLLGWPGLVTTTNPQSSVESQCMESLRVKTDAASRSRPSIYNMHFMLLWQKQQVFFKFSGALET